MVPPQHCPPAFPPEYSGMPMMMMVEQQQHHHHQHDSNARSGRTSKDPGAHPPQRQQRQHQEHAQALPLPPPPREDRVDPLAIDPLSLSGPDIIPPSDDQPISMVKNSIPSQEQSQFTTHRTRQQSHSLLTHQVTAAVAGQTATRPQRQRRSTTGNSTNNADISNITTIAKGLEPLSSTPTVISSPQPSVNPDTMTATDPVSLTTMLYTPDNDSSAIVSPTPTQHLRKASTGGGLPLSLLLNSTDGADNIQIEAPEPVQHAIEHLPDAGVNGSTSLDSQEPSLLQLQQPSVSTAGSDISVAVQYTMEAGSDQKAVGSFGDGHSPENDPSFAPVTMGTGVKRASRQMSSSSLVSAPAGKTKEPAKKRAKTEQSKRGGENDTASLFQKISSEDEIVADQQEAFNDEQDLLTALWQWKDNDPESCVCCPSKDGAFRRLIPEDPSGGWVHVVCALWLPETTLGDPDNVDRISVRDIPERNWNLTCYMCSDPQDAALGACVQCDAGQCRKSFHITCAQGYSLLETVEDSDMADPYFMYCKQHGSTDGHLRLNGWAKWVKHRDAFLKKWQDEQGLKRTLRLMDAQQSGQSDEDGGDNLVELFEHSYSRFKQAREQRIARERSELSRQYSIGYYLGNKIDKSRSRLDVISTKAEQALLEQRRIDMHTRNLLSSLLECANYLENVSAEQLQAPLSIDTTLAWYNSLPDTSRWKSDLQDIIETIDVGSLTCDNPYTQLGSHGHPDSGLDDNEGGQRHGRSSKGIYGKLPKKSGKAVYGAGKNVKSKKLYPKPTLANKSQIPVVFTSSRGRLIKRDFSDPDDCYTTARTTESPYGSDQHLGYTGGMSSVKIPRPIVPCTVCHQLTLPEDKLAIERDATGVLSPMTIKVLNRMVACDTCQRQFHPKCLDPPMARVPPRGYSWNCEDCDSSGESQGSSDETSPVLSGPHIRHQQPHQQHSHSHSSDMDEALMVLADTAMSYSASSVSFQPDVTVRAPGNATSHGLKRPLTTHDHDLSGSSFYSPSASDAPMKVKGGKSKKVKMESGAEKFKDIKPKSKWVGSDTDVTKPKVKKSHKAKVGGPDAGARSHPAQPSMVQPVAFKPAVAPIIRGNLRIYPPGPHIAPKVNNVLQQEVFGSGSAQEPENLKVKVTKKKKLAMAGTSGSPTKQEAGSAKLKKKIKSEPVSKTLSAKSKKTESVTASPAKDKTVATTPKKKSALKISESEAKPGSLAEEVKASGAIAKEKAAAIRRGSVPAVPVPPPPKPKEVIRYTVGEKTVEELTAREDVEIERRDNVKFRKLRGRTLTMPAPPQDGFNTSGTMEGESAAANGSPKTTEVAAA
ncbi:PHD finger protein 14 [Dissophora globulifera]|nr:PHD finger protein 14 [Dissophora globulifera]